MSTARSRLSSLLAASVLLAGAMAGRRAGGAAASQALTADASVSCPSSAASGSEFEAVISLQYAGLTSFSINAGWETSSLGFVECHRLDDSFDVNSRDGAGYITVEGSFHAVSSTVKVLRVKFKAVGDAGTSTRISLSGTVRTDDGSTHSVSVNRSVSIVNKKSSDNTLESLSVKGYALSPAFSPDRHEYSVKVAFETRSLDFSYKTSHSKATVSVKGNSLAENATTTVTVSVKAENGSVRNYTVRAFRPRDPSYVVSSNSRLASLVPSAGALSPPFGTEVSRYSLSVAFDQNELSFSATAEDPLASVSVMSPSRLSQGQDNLYTFTVTAENGDKREYQVVVKRVGDPSLVLSAEAQDSMIRVLSLGPNQSVSLKDTMILPARLLNALFRSENSRISAANPVGKVTVNAGSIRNVSKSYYDLTLMYSSRHDLDDAVPQGSLVFSTVYEGELFGDAVFRIFLTGDTPLNVYAYDPATQNFTLVAGGAVPQDGVVTFSHSSAGTFVLTQGEIGGAGGAANVPAAPAGFFETRRWLILLGSAVIITYCLGYLSGSALAARRQA